MNTSTATAVANSGKATKGIIMSKAKALPVVLVVVSAEDFSASLAGIASNGKAVRSQLLTACLYVSQCTAILVQKKAKKDLAVAYQTLQSTLSGVPFKLETAQSWVMRQVKAVAPKGFKWAVSVTANAKAKATSKAKAKAVTPKAKVTAEVKQTIVQLRDAWIAKETANLDAYRNFIPSGKIKDVEQATAAYIATLKIILA